MQFQSIQEICDKIGARYISETEYLQDDILDIFNNHQVHKYLETNDPKLMTWIATYFNEIRQNESETLHFLIKAMNAGDETAINNLACFWFEKRNFPTSLCLWKLCNPEKDYIKVNIELVNKKLN